MYQFFRDRVWLGCILLFILAYLLRRLRLWIKRVGAERKTRQAEEEKRRAAAALEALKCDRAHLYQETVDLVRRSPHGKRYKIEVVDGIPVRTEVTGGKDGADVVLVPYGPLDGADMRRQKEIDAAERRANEEKAPHRKVTRGPVPEPRSLSSMIAEDKERARQRDAQIRAEARQLAEEHMDPATREGLMLLGGQEAVDKALDEAVDAVMARIDQESKKLSGRLYNAENTKEANEKLRRGLMATGEPLSSAITPSESPEK